MVDAAIRCDRPWLELDLGRPHRLLSWAVHRPGFTTARRVIWREVRDADLPPDLDPARWLAEQLARRLRRNAVAMLTARNVTRFTRATVRRGAITAQALATVGLGNAERIGGAPGTPARTGTINIAVWLDHSLTGPAMIEAISIAASARTQAMLEQGPDLPTGRATGTGTDCLVIAAPPGDTALPYAGLHTDAGHAIGAAVLAATTQGITDWRREFAG